MSNPVPQQQTGLLLIDLQQGFNDPSYWGSNRSTPTFEASIARLLTSFRRAHCPIFHVVHHSLFDSSPLHPSKSTVDFMSYAAPQGSEPIFVKNTNSAFVQTDVRQAIQDAGVRRLVICGLVTAHCVSTSVRMASNMGIVEHGYGTPSDAAEGLKGRIVLVKDATATFDVKFEGKVYDAETVHAVHLASLNHEFCDVESTDDVLQKLEESSQSS